MVRRGIHLVLIVAFFLATSRIAFTAGRPNSQGSAPEDGRPYVQLQDDFELERGGDVDLAIEDFCVLVLQPRFARITTNEKPAASFVVGHSCCTRAPPASRA